MKNGKSVGLLVALAFATTVATDIAAQSSHEGQAAASGNGKANAAEGTARNLPDMRLWSFGDCDNKFPFVNSDERKECVRVVGSEEARDARAYRVCETSNGDPERSPQEHAGAKPPPNRATPNSAAQARPPPRLQREGDREAASKRQGCCSFLRPLALPRTPSRDPTPFRRNDRRPSSRALAFGAVLVGVGAHFCPAQVVGGMVSAR
jgi:hypothetical protein